MKYFRRSLIVLFAIPLYMIGTVCLIIEVMCSSVKINLKDNHGEICNAIKDLWRDA